MNNKTEAQVLAGAYESVRNLSKLYISRLKDIDVSKQYSIDGVKLNPAYWITAHLVWTEHYLLVQGIGNKTLDIPWLDEFGFGSSPEEVKIKPGFKEILMKLDEVHQEAMKILMGISDEEIEKPNYIEADFGGVNNKRNVITHAIRHEPMHIGQLSWILKAGGVKMP